MMVMMIMLPKQTQGHPIGNSISVGVRRVDLLLGEGVLLQLVFIQEGTGH
jgi:hypothetical protein